MATAASNLLAFLERVDIPAIQLAIAPDLAAFRRGLQERGRGAPVALHADQSGLIVTARHLLCLAEARLSGALDAAELMYVATALELSPSFRFESESVRDVAQVLAERDATTSDLREVVDNLHALSLRKRMERSRDV
jgi:hypothetical protein